jgi:hypothetical protein
MVLDLDASGLVLDFGVSGMELDLYASCLVLDLGSSGMTLDDVGPF